MKLKDLEILIENALRNVKRGQWEIKQGKDFILKKIKEFFDESLDDK